MADPSTSVRLAEYLNSRCSPSDTATVVNSTAVAFLCTEIDALRKENATLVNAITETRKQWSERAERFDAVMIDFEKIIKDMLKEVP